MCTRYRFEPDGEDGRVAAFLAAMERRFAGAYRVGDVGPGTVAPALAARGGRVAAVAATFGVPSPWAAGKLTLNARSETAGRKALFAEGWRTRRMLLPATGFYEWSRDGKKTKHFFALEDGRTFYLCGIGFAGEGGLRFAILTRAAEGAVAAVHERMPAIVGAEDVRSYLTDLDAAERLIAGPAPRWRDGA